MLKKVAVPLVIGGALLVGGLSVGTAYASSSPSTPGASAPASVTAPAHTGQLHLRAWLRDHRRQIRRQTVIVSAKTIGVTPKALVAELRSGKSIAEVASEHNVRAQAVTSALTGAATAKINQAVSEGKLTASEGQKIESLLPHYIGKAVQRVR